MNQPPPEPPRQAAVAFEVTSLAGGRKRRIDPGWIVIALVAALVLAAIAHPWQTSEPSIAVVPGPSNESLGTPAPSIEPAPPAPQTKSSADMLATEVYDLGMAAAPWGVGLGAAVGPPLQPTLETPALGVATDQAWWAWIEVDPLVGTTPAETSAAIDVLPVTKLCAGVPHLPTGAQILEITTPGGTPDPVQVAGWHEVGWHDEPRDIEPLVGFGGLLPRRTGDVTYLELVDGEAWPDGRYEFRVAGSTSASPASLTVCLGQP